MPSLIELSAAWVLNRPYVKQMLLRQSPPAYMKAEVGNDQMTFESYFQKLSEIKQQQVALSIAWLYADIDLLSKKITASKLHVKRLDGEKKVAIQNHPYEQLLHNPNDFMPRSFLLRYLIFWLSLSDKGAFLYFAPERGNPNNILQLWPINSNRIEPIKDRQNFVKWFRYTPKKGEKAYNLNARHVLWLRYPDPHNYWGSLPPIRAALDAISIEVGIMSSQKKLYTKGRGIPLSIVSVDPDMAPPDFAQFRQDIKDDWADDSTTLAIARGGTLDVKGLGFSQKDLEILGNQELTRDRIDSIFFGIPFRNADFASGDGLKQAEKFINDNVIHPLHILLAEYQTQMLGRFWGTNLVAEYEDIRATDRALTIQENNVNLRWQTVDEMREKQGIKPLEDSEVGALLVPLATNPSFIANLKGFDANANRVAEENDPGNMADTLAPEATANNLADDAAKAVSISVQYEAIRAELKRRKTVAKRSFRNSNDALKREFVTDIIPADLVKNINIQLGAVLSEDEIDTIFAPIINQFTI